MAANANAVRLAPYEAGIEQEDRQTRLWRIEANGDRAKHAGRSPEDAVEFACDLLHLAPGTVIEVWCPETNEHLRRVLP